MPSAEPNLGQSASLAAWREVTEPGSWPGAWELRLHDDWWHRVQPRDDSTGRWMVVTFPSGIDQRLDKPTREEAMLAAEKHARIWADADLVRGQTMIQRSNTALVALGERP